MTPQDATLSPLQCQGRVLLLEPNALLRTRNVYAREGARASTRQSELGSEQLEIDNE
jgi:hypothetical protein